MERGGAGTGEWPIATLHLGMGGSKLMQRKVSISSHFAGRKFLF